MADRVTAAWLGKITGAPALRVALRQQVLQRRFRDHR
jgi:hypothetical protein